VNKFATITFSVLCLIVKSVCAQAQATGANVPEQNIQAVIYVNNTHPLAADVNPGTQDLPVKTVSRAAVMAWEKNRKNLGVKILIAPGTYRESVDVWQETDAPIVFEAQQKGKVAIAGSDVWRGWKRQGASNIYTHAWPYNWGLSELPAGWSSDPEAQNARTPIVRRREMITLAGKFLTQVLSYAELVEGSFYVDEVKDTVYLWPPAAITMTPTTIAEVAVRPFTLLALQKKNLILRGIIFKHANSPFNANAVELGSSSNLLIEDCQFIWNNWGGVGVGSAHQVTVRRSSANYNGGIGMGAAFGKNFLFEDNETSGNNWRGVKGGYIGWSVAGLKHLFIHGAIYRRHRAVSNQTVGFWLDSDSSNILIDGAFLDRNLVFGMFIEANQGPITVTGSTVCHNKGPGLLINNSENVTLQSNILYGNERTQLLLEGAPPAGRPMDNWETGEQRLLVSRWWVLKDNEIVGKKANQLLIEVNLGGATSPAWLAFKNSFTSSKNLWYNSAASQSFRIFGWSVEARNVDLNGWRASTGQDMDSTFAKPHFLDPDKHQF